MMAKCPFLEDQGKYVGYLTEAYLEDLGKDLDNANEFKGSWRQFGFILLNLDDRELNDILRRSRSDGKQSPTWCVFQRYVSKCGRNVDITKLWWILHHEMGRADSASALEEWYSSNRVFYHQQQQRRVGDVLGGSRLPESHATLPPQESDFTGEDRLPHSQQTCVSEGLLGQPISVATYPPEEGSDISSLRNNDTGLGQSVRIKDLTLLVDNVHIYSGSAKRRHHSTETDSLKSSSTGSTSSLSREQEVVDQPSRVDLPLTPLSELLKVFITYADHDEQKAKDISMHLSFYGCEVTLDNPDKMSERARRRKCKEIFRKSAVIIVIYSSFYKRDVLMRGAGSRNTRYIYSLMKDAYEKKGSNQRIVLYPMFQIQKGIKIPRIFNHLPTSSDALTIHRLLFRETKQEATP